MIVSQIFCSHCKPGFLPLMQLSFQIPALSLESRIFAISVQTRAQECVLLWLESWRHSLITSPLCIAFLVPYTANSESSQLLGNGRWKAPIAGVFSSIKCSLSTFPGIAIHNSAALGKAPSSSAKWSLQGRISIPSADHLIQKCLHIWHPSMTSSSISRCTQLLVRAGFCPALLILHRDKCTHPDRHMPALQHGSWVPLCPGGCCFDCGAHRSASVQQGGCRQAILSIGGVGGFSWWPLGATGVVLRTKNPFFSKSAGQTLSGAYTEPWPPGEGEMV